MPAKSHVRGSRSAISAFIFQSVSARRHVLQGRSGGCIRADLNCWRVDVPYPDDSSQPTPGRSPDRRVATPATTGDRERRGSAPTAILQTAYGNTFSVAASEADSNLHHRRNHGDALRVLHSLSGIALSGVPIISSRTWADATMRF